MRILKLYIVSGLLSLSSIGCSQSNSKNIFYSTVQLSSCCPAAYYKLRFIFTDTTYILQQKEGDKWRTNSVSSINKIYYHDNSTTYQAVDKQYGHNDGTVIIERNKKGVIALVQRHDMISIIYQ